VYNDGAFVQKYIRCSCKAWFWYMVEQMWQHEELGLLWMVGRRS